MIERTFDENEIDRFIKEGFLKLENAFSSELAAEAREILWRDTGCDPNDRSTWTSPVIRLGNYDQPPFAKAANTPQLHAAFDQLVGKDRWYPRTNLGAFPVRFPSDKPPGDDGWHVDASFGEMTEPFSSWRVNINSRDRALLMLFLFSDVSMLDAPTRIRVGSHIEVAKILAPHGEKGLTFMELAGKLDATSGCEETFATGPAGTVYLCHPFIAHAAQPHRGSEPRFMAQPPLIPRGELEFDRKDENYSAVERAVRPVILKFKDQPQS